ncbi:MAG: hypothetical protein ABRQ38_15565 [Candidatus Eremiobacterota bacterium]
MDSIGNKMKVTIPEFSKSDKLEDQKNPWANNHSVNVEDLVLISNYNEDRIWSAGERMKQEFETLKSMKSMKNSDKCGCECKTTEVDVQICVPDAGSKDNSIIKGDVMLCHIDDDPSTEDKIEVEGKFHTSKEGYDSVYSHINIATNDEIRITYQEKDGYLRKSVQEDATVTHGRRYTSAYNAAIHKDDKPTIVSSFHQKFAFVVNEDTGAIVQEQNYLPKD